MAKQDVPDAEVEALDAPKRLAAWQWVMVAVAGAVTVLGGVLTMTGAPAAAEGAQADRAQVEHDGVGGFLPGEGSIEDDPEVVGEEVAAGDDAISPAIFRLGFSFLMGFAIAYAVRTFVKISLIAIGVFAIGLFGLEYLGVIEVHWEALGGHYDGARDYLAAQTSSFKDFITGQLPMAGSALAGMVVGFKKA